LSEQKHKIFTKKEAIGSVLLVTISIIVLAVIISSLPGLNVDVPDTIPTPTPVYKPQPTPKQSITISYYDPVTSESLYWTSSNGLTYEDKADSGKVFLTVVINIYNDGYYSFNTNPNYFNVTVDYVDYSYDSATYLLDKWSTFDVLNGGEYTGTMVFQVPSSATYFSLHYARAGKDYNISYKPID
jgi:hypothetical protein